MLVNLDSRQHQILSGQDFEADWNIAPKDVASFVLLLWSGDPGSAAAAERICLPFPRAGARERGRINGAPAAAVYLDLFCRVWFWKAEAEEFPDWCVQMFEEHLTVIGTYNALLGT